MKILNVKSYFFILVFIIFSQKNFAQNIDLSKPVGTTSSQSGVSPTGGISYIIPIEALKGSNNMSPNVNLTYNSQSGEGIAGFGWNLSAYSVISRQGKRQYFNGQNTPVSFQNTLDAFLLDGQRLFPLTGTNGNNGVIYGTENENFSKIESFGGSGISGPDWFKVTTRDGVVLEYGADAGSRVWNDGSTSIMYWLLRRVIDKAGNYQLYSYEINHSNRYFALTEIAYTGNTNINQLPYNKIEFTYNFIPNWQNRKAFDGGSKIVSPYLLDKINIKNVNDIIVRSYKCDYTIVENQSFLTSLSESGSDGLSFNPLTFQYGSNISAQDFTISPEYPGFSGNNTFTGEMTGDGKQDVLAARFYYDNSNIPHYTGYDVIEDFTTYGGQPAFSLAYTYNIPQGPAREIKGHSSGDKGFFNNDYDGDGKADVLMVSSLISGNSRTFSGVEINYSRKYNGYSSTYKTVDYPGIPYAYPNLFYRYIYNGGTYFIPGDFDGDGAQDYILILGANSTGMYKAFFSSPAKNIINQEIANFGVDGYSNDPYYAATIAIASDVTPIDFDGDGKMELLIQKPGKSFILSIGPGYSGYQYGASVVYTFTNLIKGNRVFPGDFNGDGKTDLLVRTGTNTPSAQWNVLYSTGKEFISYPFIFQNYPYLDGDNGGSAHHLVVADLNHDGKTDVWHSLDLSSNSSKHTLYVSNGVPLNNTNSLSAFAIYNYYANTAINRDQTVQSVIGDFNFDGKPDIFSIKGTKAKIVYLRPDKESNLMAKAVNGLGAAKEFFYQKGYNRSWIYDIDNSSAPLGQGANGNPYTVLKTPMYVLNQMSEADGLGGYNYSSFQYEDAMYHPLRGFLGFKKVSSYDGSSGISSTSFSEMNTDVLIPVMNRSTTDQYGSLLSETLVNNNLSRLNPGSSTDKRYVSQISDTKSFNYITGAGSETINIYDTYGNIKKESAKVGPFSGTTITALETVISERSYTSSFTPIPSLPSSETVSKTRSGQSMVAKTTTYNYNAKGLVASVTDFSGTAIDNTMSFSYDNFGNILTQNVSAPNTPTTTFTYDPKGRNLLTKSATGSGITKNETYTYDDLYINLSTSQSSDGLTTSFKYDGFGNVTQTILPDGNIIKSDIAWETATGRGRYSISSYRVSDDGLWNKTYFDITGREIRKESKGFNNQLIFSTIQYNQKGQVYKQAQPRYDTEPTVEVTNLYDYLGRLTSVSNGSTTNSYSYHLASGGLYTTTTTNGANQSSSKTTDASGKVVRTNDNGGQLDFTYDSWGNQKETKIGSTSLIVNNFDSYGRQTSMTDKNAGTITYEYDALGRLTKQTDAKNNIHTILYDAFGRITSKTGPAGTTSYTYYSEPGKTNDHITSITGFAGDTKTYQYDHLQRVKSESTGVDGQTFTKTFEYDGNGNLKKTTYPSGIIINDTYDINDIPYQTSMTYNGITQTLFTANAMNSRGIFTGYSYGNGKSSTVYYDLVKGAPMQYNTAGIQNLFLDFNANTGNLTARNDLIKGLVEIFSYDNLNRLTGASVNNVEQFAMTYDNNSGNSLGNIQTKSDIGNYRYDAQKINAVRFITTNSGTPSNPPNILSINTQAITYTPFLKTATIAENGFQVAYTYGHDEQRIKSVLKQNATILETKYYLGSYEKQIKGSATREIHYINAGNGLCAIIVKENGIVIPYFVYSDHLGSPLTITNSVGTVVTEQNFDAWGRYRNPSNWTYNSVPARPDWLYRGYTGHEHLVQFALINMNGRMYDPATCRMLSPDNYVPLPWNTQGYNRYGYANNNPLIYTDPDGEFFWLLIPIVIGAGINIYDNWSDIKSGFNEGGVWNGLGRTLGYAAVGAAQGVTTAYLAPVSPILSSVVSNVIGSVGNGAISGTSAADIITNTAQGVFSGIATGGFSQGFGGSFDKAGAWVTNKISNKISSGVISNFVGSFVSNFGVNLTTNTAFDALDGGEFNFGDNLKRAAHNAFVSSVIDGAATYANEYRQRQIDNRSTQTTGYSSDIIDQVMKPQEITASTNPITNTPPRIPYQPQPTFSTNTPQKNINTINRLKRRLPTTTIIYNFRN